MFFFTLNYKHWKSQPIVSVFCLKRCSWKWQSVKLPAANKCNCSWYGLMFITWKHNTMSKNQVWSQNWLRHTCNVFVFTFIQHLFKGRDVLHIGCLVEKNDKPQSFSFNTNKFNLKQVKQKPLEVCVIGKVVGCLEFYIFAGYKNINILLVILFTINIFT